MSSGFSALVVARGFVVAEVDEAGPAADSAGAVDVVGEDGFECAGVAAELTLRGEAMDCELKARVGGGVYCVWQWVLRDGSGRLDRFGTVAQPYVIK